MSKYYQITNKDNTNFIKVNTESVFSIKVESSNCISLEQTQYIESKEIIEFMESDKTGKIEEINELKYLRIKNKALNLISNG